MPTKANRWFRSCVTDENMLPGWVRLSLLMLGISLAVALVAAALLEPNEAGYGTHQQLGLAECTMARLMGQPCPSCGMTTAWAHLMRGNFVAASGTNLGGLLTCLLALVTVPWTLASAVSGRWWPTRPAPSLVIGVAIAVVIVTLTDWLAKLLS